MTLTPSQKRVLVRAKVKNREHYPPEWFCCEDGYQHDQLLGEIIVNIAEQRPFNSHSCNFCLASAPNSIDVQIVSGERGRGCWIPLPLLDIDEGEISE